MSYQENSNEQFGQAKDWKLTIRNLGLKEWLEIVGIVILIAYTTATFLQLRETRETNRFAQRASIDLGSSDGEIADFLDDGRILAVYVRNTGATAAKQTHIEIFPETVYRGHTKTDVIPAFKGWGEEQQITGLVIPTGSPYRQLREYDPTLAADVRRHAATLTIYGRISFADAFGRYCQSFCLEYNHVLAQFTLSVPVPDFCSEEATPITSITER